MLPELCHIGPFTVYSYGLMLVLAFFIAAHLAGRQAARSGADPQKIFDLCFYVFIAGIVGSRLLYIIDNLPFSSGTPRKSLCFNMAAWLSSAE